MTLIDALQINAGLLIFATALLGLIVGSFLNVVILRLPRMMEIAWQQECRETLDLAAEQPSEKLSLVSPPSRCNG